MTRNEPMCVLNNRLKSALLISKASVKISRKLSSFQNPADPRNLFEAYKSWLRDNILLRGLLVLVEIMYPGEYVKSKLAGI